MIRVLIAEDQQLVRQGIRALLAPAKDVDVVGEAKDGEQAVELAAQLAPDVILMDVFMPALNGFQAMEKIRALRVPSRFLVLSMHVDQDHVAQALQNRVHGYLLKDCGRIELLSAIRAVFQGRPYFSSEALKYFTPAVSGPA